MADSERVWTRGPHVRLLPHFAVALRSPAGGGRLLCNVMGKVLGFVPGPDDSMPDVPSVDIEVSAAVFEGLRLQLPRPAVDLTDAERLLAGSAREERVALVGRRLSAAPLDHMALLDLAHMLAATLAEASPALAVAAVHRVDWVLFRKQERIRGALNDALRAVQEPQAPEDPAGT